MIVGIQAALGALDGDAVCCLIDSDSTPAGMTMGFLPILDIVFYPFLTTQRPGPRRNVRSTSSLIGHDALEVEMIAVPRPFMTFGISSQLV